MKKNLLTMIIVCAGCTLVLTAFSLAVSSSTMPGETVTDMTLSQTVAGATIKGYCSDGAACVYDAGGCPTDDDGVTCLASINAQVCGIATGALNQTCNSEPESPYSCVTDLPTQKCASLNTRCEQIAEGCVCGTLYGGEVQVCGGIRTVC